MSKKIGIIGAQVTNTETDPRLWEQIDELHSQTPTSSGNLALITMSTSWKTE